MARFSLFLSVLALVGCGLRVVPSAVLSPLAMTQAGGEVTVSLGCERQGVTSVELRNTEGILWRIESQDSEGTPLEQFTVGLIPNGFAEVSALGGDVWGTGDFLAEVRFSPRGRTAYGWLASEGVDGWSYQEADDDHPWEDYQEWVRTDEYNLEGWVCP